MAEKEYRVNVYEDEMEVLQGDIVARVRYNQRLDYWNGRNWENGGTGRHLGITKLKDGRYVLIHGTQWQGERDYGVIVSPMTALQAILKSQHLELLETKKFAGLKALATEKGLLDSESDDEEE